MKEERRELLKEWRDISWWDKLRAYFQKTPATFGEYNQAYSDFIISVLDGEVLEVVDVDKYNLKVFDGTNCYKFWIGNYPYSYGKLEVDYRHKWFHSNLNWEAVLKVRELQLRHREEFFRKYDEEQSKLYD